MSSPSRPGEFHQPDHAAALVAQLRAEGGTAAFCGCCHERIPSVSGVGLTMFATPGRRFVLGTSGLLIDEIEDLQIQLDQGPCVEAFTSRTPILVENLADAAARRSWPRFAPEALRAGVAAVFAYPVLAGAEPVAVLDLCRAGPGPLPDDDDRRARTFAVAASALLIDDLYEGDSAGAAVSSTAARTQQATGMVMGQATIGAGAALHRLRDDALDRDLPLSVVVNEVLAGRLRFDSQPGS
ncbi:MAG: GAF domain-containing protein [Actinoplanes sp.]